MILPLIKRQQCSVHEPTPNPKPTPKLQLSGAAHQAKNRIFFGGSFDPPHQGHAQLPIQIADTFESSSVIFVPAARSPFKDTNPTPGHHRIAMLEIALAHHRNCEIWAYELLNARDNPNEPSYWADTWASATEQLTPGTNMFLIGADQAISMHRWKHFTEFWKDAIVMLRPHADTPINRCAHFNDQRQHLLDQLDQLNVWSPEDLDHWETRIIETPSTDASSTHIRAALMNPATRQSPIQGLNQRVHEYILSNKLYLKS